ncbi:hypothetical protein JQC67_18045 [Aurantibacter crassamenti]|uniref:hypothetical protein n=1 Tax=Aurantibacter crassamenti TaxID=1837375 RepID=UPI0019395AFF|nr:hypothetical protein [Aurantibacter crassamenti]MBM1108059.1 hypothetical protein [Aurantibacter crassamenti]
MIKKLLIILLFVTTGSIYGQIDSQLLLGLTNATTSEINALTGASEGQMLYNEETKQVMIFNGTLWTNTSNSNWLATGNTVTNGSYLGTNNDAILDLRSNSTSILQFGRRQTLGLTQGYTNYDNNDQYLTYLKGSNGVAALQFQADAASFYKPMFYTTSDGNFRLKGSAANTDFFEIGSNGVSNAGELEFVIGDDGAEPFIFKRYDYRDALKKELFRIQGASDSQAALPRIGINTGQLANSTLQVEGSIATAINTATSNISLNETHHTVIITNNSNIVLPAATTCNGRTYIIKNQNNSAITITGYLDNEGNSSTSIGASSILQIQSNGTVWHSITPGKTNNKFFMNFSGRAYFYTTWYSPHDQYGMGYQNWNAAKGTGVTPSYSTANQFGVPITSNATLAKFSMKNDFNSTNGLVLPSINLSVLRNGSIINIGTYILTSPSTSVNIQTNDVGFMLLEGDLLLWATKTTSGSRVNYTSLTFEFTY